MVRKEDERLVTGHGHYIADLALPGETHAVVMRSSHAHALIKAIDTSAAAAAPGVLGIITAEDEEIAGLGRIPWEVPPPALPDAVTGQARDPMAALQPVLAQGRVRYIGEPLAFVVAESLAEARDAAEQILVDYQSLPAVTDAVAATRSAAPQLFAQYPGNLYFRVERGDEQAVAAAFAKAAHVTEIALSNNRLAANPMEPRGYLAEYDAETARYTLHAAASKPHLLKRTIAAAILRIAEDRIRVLVRDVGGGFGAKNHVYPEQVLALIAARRLNRPVKWIADRAEMMMSDAHGRDQQSRAALALDGDGRFLGIRATTVANLGAYLSPRGVVSPLSGGRTLPGAYTIPAAHLEVQAVLTNTVPTAPYRGAGQPEVMFLLERLVDAAARETGIAPDELRRRNLIPIEAMPYRNALGTVYDTGAFGAILDQALERSGWPDFATRRDAAARRGKLRGIGLSYTIEACGFGVDETAEVRIGPEGRATVAIGTMSNGQGHETVYAQIAAAALGLAPEDVDVIQGDTDRISSGNGTGASRSITVGGSALALACRDLIAATAPLAARLLQGDPAEISFEKGRFRPRSGQGELDWPALARAAVDTPGAAASDLCATHRFVPDNYTFPNGCHVCEVEVDPETGVVEVQGYVMVHDVGVAIDTTLVAGQLQGGVTQGIGQALLEQVRYEEGSAQMVSGSFLDYAMPRADNVPDYVLALAAGRSTVNPLGARSCGEAGPTAAPPAVINALVDALSPLGIRNIDMPATPLGVWHAIRQARGRDS